MGSHKEWRKIAKKTMRRRKRIQSARERDDKIRLEENERFKSPSYKLWLEEQNRLEKIQEEEDEHEKNIQNERWLLEEKLAQQRWIKLQERLERLKTEKAKQELILRAEWEEEQRKMKEKAELRELAEKRKNEEQAAFVENIERYIVGDCETLPSSAKTLIESLPGEKTCPFFEKVAACRYGNNCSRNHIRPSISRTLLLAGFYSHFRMDHTNKSDEYDTDVGLEYDDEEIYNDFLEFYDDVLHELRTYGPVVQFKICCNEEAHLRGNVYVQYSEDRYAIKAYRALHGRFYGGRRLTVEFCTIRSWSKAICGLFKAKRCPKSGKCNFMHVFRDPDREFYHANRDIFDFLPPTSQTKKKIQDLNWSPSTESTDSAYKDVIRNGNKRCGWRWSPSPERSPCHRHQYTKSSKIHSNDRSGCSSNKSPTKSARPLNDLQRRYDRRRRRSSNHRRRSRSKK